MPPIAITAYTATTAAGLGRGALAQALFEGRSALAPCRFETATLETWIGTVDGLEVAALRDDLTAWDCRNHRLAQLGLEQDGFAAAVAAARERYGPGRVGVFLGTSTAGILETEVAYRARDPASGALPAALDYRRTHNSFALADFVRARLGLSGPAAAVCTACSSSAKVFGMAQRMLGAGLVDAAVVGGVDSLCLTTLYGFHSLQLLAARACRPFDRRREGLSIGEAAGFMLLEAGRPGPLALLGVGESSDAHHMSAPCPDGSGARAAMAAALAAAGLAPAAVDYINLHGTATAANDAAEAQAINALFDATLVCNSTKGVTGHALGAAGAVEAVVAALALEHQRLPASCGTVEVTPELRADYRIASAAHPLRVVMSNSFGFGGSNCALLIGGAA